MIRMKISDFSMVTGLIAKEVRASLWRLELSARQLASRLHSWLHTMISTLRAIWLRPCQARVSAKMGEWVPVLALPNLDMRGAIECDYAAIMSPADHRVEHLRKDHPTLTTFLSKFSG